MTWITLPSVSVQNGSKIVTVNNTQTTNIKVGDALLIGNYQPVEIAGVFATQLSLRTNWSNAAQANASAVVLPTFGDFNAATQALRQATQVTQGNFKTLEDWGTKLGKITFEGQDNSKHTARTLLQMDADVSELEEQANNLIVSLSGLNFALSKAIVDALRSGNKEQYAASGFIHYGKHYTESIAPNVNDGMTCAANTPNNVAIGRATSQITGSSETNYAVMNVAGFTSNLITSETHSMFTIKFPEAPNGTVVSDSSGNCRGTGKPTLDLSKEVDPRYGDVADSVNEAVGRAFEGAFKNGDYRLGDNGDWFKSGAITFNADGTVTAAGNGYISQSALAFVAGQTIVIKGYISEALTLSNHLLQIDAVGGATPNYLYNRDALLGVGNTSGSFEVTITLPTGTTSVSARLRAGESGSVTYGAISIRTVTEEVVTERVDMAGLEFFKEKVGAYLYPYGMIQGKATIVDGVATTEDTVRPITYFAVFEGDTTSRGRGWKLADLTFVQLATIMSNPEHNAWYNEAGELMQFRGRQRSFAGLGNGDWRVINPKGDILSFGTENLTRVAAQGRLDTPASPSGGGNFFAGYTFTAHNAKPEVGMFTVSSNSGDYQAPDGECYFYVLATVPRLNQGAYHQSLNPMGTAFIAHETNPEGNAYWWYSNEMPANWLTSTLSCFSKKSPRAGYTGKIGDAAKARPDGKCYDAIYASGQGGVIDWRLPARDMSSKEDAAKIFQKLVNGTYRGLEKLTKTFFDTNKDADNVAGSGFTPSKALSSFSVGDTGYIEGIDGVYREYKVKAVTTIVQFETPVSRKGGGIVLHTGKTNISVSGNFTTLDVVGSIERILSIPALANGWMGGRIAKTPDGTAVAYSLTRKNVGPIGIGRQYSNNSGVVWTSDTPYMDATTNTLTSSLGDDTVQVLTYTAFAKQTKRSTNKPVLNGSEGLGDVWNYCYNTIDTGNLLMESVLGKIGTNGTINPNRISSKALLEKSLRADGKLNDTSSSWSPYNHEPIVLGEPANNSPAVKALWHQASNNQQATLNFLWNELIFDTNWRTPDKVWSGGSVSVAVGETFRAESSSAYAVAGLLMRCVKALTANATVLGAMHVGMGGDVISLTDGQTYFKVVNNGWSDDSTIRMIDGVGTFNNENGDTCLYGTDELAMPYGYTKNQAGAGKQVVGVDL